MGCFCFNGKDVEKGRGNTNDQYDGHKNMEDHQDDHHFRRWTQVFLQIVKKHDQHIVDLQQKALDDVVHVNSLFTIAVFVGLAFAPGQRSLGNRRECDADSGVAKRLITYEVVSFACFLFSSLTAKTLKVQLHIYNFVNSHITFIKYKLIRGFMLLVSFLASLMGIIFLTLSMINVIQIRLGKLSCGTDDALQAVAALCGIVFVALAIYLPSTLNVIWVLITTSEFIKDQNNQKDQISDNKDDNKVHEK